MVLEPIDLRRSIARYPTATLNSLTEKISLEVCTGDVFRTRDIFYEGTLEDIKYLPRLSVILLTDTDLFKVISKWKDSVAIKKKWYRTTYVSIADFNDMMYKLGSYAGVYQRLDHVPSYSGLANTENVLRSLKGAPTYHGCYPASRVFAFLTDRILKENSKSSVPEGYRLVAVINGTVIDNTPSWILSADGPFGILYRDMIPEKIPQLCITSDYSVEVQSSNKVGCILDLSAFGGSKEYRDDLLTIGTPVQTSLQSVIPILDSRFTFQAWSCTDRYTRNPTMAFTPFDVSTSAAPYLYKYVPNSLSAPLEKIYFTMINRVSGNDSTAIDCPVTLHPRFSTTILLQDDQATGDKIFEKTVSDVTKSAYEVGEEQAELSNPQDVVYAGVYQGDFPSTEIDENLLDESVLVKNINFSIPLRLAYRGGAQVTYTNGTLVAEYDTVDGVKKITSVKRYYNGEFKEILVGSDHIVLTQDPEIKVYSSGTISEYAGGVYRGALSDIIEENVSTIQDRSVKTALRSVKHYKLDYTDAGDPGDSNWKYVDGYNYSNDYINITESKQAVSVYISSSRRLYVSYQYYALGSGEMYHMFDDVLATRCPEMAGKIIIPICNHKYADSGVTYWCGAKVAQASGVEVIASPTDIIKHEKVFSTQSDVYVASTLSQLLMVEIPGKAGYKVYRYSAKFGYNSTSRTAYLDIRDPDEEEVVYLDTYTLHGYQPISIDNHVVWQYPAS